MRTPPASVLKWTERALLALGLALGAWAAFVVVENWYYARMPIPSARHLPGEEPTEAVGTTGPAASRVERGTWLARLEAPSVQMRATVLEGSDDRTLRRAAGHIEYTPLPGQHGNAGIAGHRDTTFYPVRNLKRGDPLILTTADRVLEYTVTDTWIVEPEAVEVLDPTERPSLTLVTCYPFNFVGNAPKRFIVRAELVAGPDR